jgi:hypothetical protein
MDTTPKNDVQLWLQVLRKKDRLVELAKRNAAETRWSLAAALDQHRAELRAEFTVANAADVMWLEQAVTGIRDTLPSFMLDLPREEWAGMMEQTLARFDTLILRIETTGSLLRRQQT